MAQDVGLEPLPGFPGGPELVDCLEGVEGVVSAPLGFGLGVEDLADGDDGEGMGDDCSDGSCEAANESLFSVAEVVVGLDGLEGIVEDGVDGVPDGEVGEPAVEVGVEALIEY